MRLVTRDEMRELDRATIEDHGTPGLVLMERAGRGVVRELTRLLLRRAGARYLTEAAQLFRRTDDEEAARKCEHDLAEWCTREGHYEEAIEAWLRAGEVVRAVKAARIVLDGGRLQPTHPAFRAARRAAREARDHEFLARLQEAEGSWTGAARAWQAAGRHDRAAENYRRSGQLEEAAELP